MTAVEHTYRHLVERLPVVSYVAEPGPDGVWTYVSPQIERMLGYTPDEWLKDPDLWARCVHPDDRERAFEEEARLKAGEQLPDIEYRMFTRTGELIWIRDHGLLRAEPEDDGRRLLDGVLTDITDRKLAESRLQHLADHDVLTGLLNRRRFIEDLTLEHALSDRHQRQSSVLIVDVDNFKYVNDSLGHQAGDEMIRSLAHVLSRELREIDTLARLGGDEFAILLRGSTGEQAITVAERLIEAVRTHEFAIGSEPVRVTVSIGIAVVGSDSDTADTTLAAADLAMYQSKQSGRNRLAEFSPALRSAAEQRHTWADRIRRALEEDGFLLFQQPILDIASGLVSQHELLIRMQGEDGAIIGPGQFLPVAERFDLVQAIDRWVVRQAIRLIAAAEGAGHELVLEVNLSGRSMGDEQLFELLEADLRESGIDASKLVLEMTETAAIENMEEARTFARRLRSLGCGLALDDFGSGFGSFYYLKHLPFDYLKIDGDFIRNLQTSAVDQAVVRAIVQIAESVGYRTVAEFVHDGPTLEAVRDFGVHLAQGFHVGVPEPVASLQVW